jgi:protein tyrosine/serine phosphatase
MKAKNSTHQVCRIGKGMCRQAALLFVLLFAVSAHAFNFSEADKRRCFMDDPTAKTITFIYSMEDGYWPKETLSSAYVCGSFNGWSQSDANKLSYDEESNCWTLTVSYANVNIPGNSGQPEYKFVINGDWKFAPSWLTPGYEFLTSDRNMIVVFSTDNLEQIKANSIIASTVRPLSSYDLTKANDQATVSNFRLVPGTSKLYRSYHPFKASRNDGDGIDTEHARLQYVAALATAVGIQSDICLSGDETGSLGTYTAAGVTYNEAIPAYFQNMIDKGNVLNVYANNKVPSYSYVYTKSNSKYFGDWITEIVDFIIADNHPAPFQIHCRLGTDRTGVISAVLGAMCGASWDEVSADYQLSNNLQIKEFRDHQLLAYSLRNILGVDDITKVENLGQALSDYFVNNGYLTADKIQAMRAKLTTTTAIEAIASQAQPTAAPVYYNVAGQRVSSLIPGNIYISQGKKLVYHPAR